MKLKVLFFIVIVFPLFLMAQPFAKKNKSDISKDKVLYTVGYTHLDTQWKWDYHTTVDEFIRKTMIIAKKEGDDIGYYKLLLMILQTMNTIK